MNDENVFFVDKAGDKNHLHLDATIESPITTDTQQPGQQPSDDSEEEEEMKTVSFVSFRTYQKPATAFTTKPRAKQKKGKGKYKGKRKTNYGFSDGIDMRGKPPEDPESLIDDDVVQDFVVNADAIDFDLPVTNLATMSLNLGESDTDELEIESTAGIYEALSLPVDGEEEEDDNDDDESTSSVSHDFSGGDANDGQESDDTKPMFSGGRSAWDRDTPTATENGNFKQILNGDFGDVDVGGISKSAMRKKKQHEKAAARLDSRNRKLALMEEQKRISAKMYGKKAGDAVDSDVIKMLQRVNQSLYEFVTDPNELQSTPLPPMPSALRSLAKLIAAHYNVTTKTRGSKTNKVLIIIRTRSTLVPGQWNTIVERVIQSDRNGILKGNTRLGNKSGVKKVFRPPGAPDNRGMPRVGELVAEQAAPISDDNVGHRMLLAMGWSPGESLGASNLSENRDSDALTTPISVMIRERRRGLGAD